MKREWGRARAVELLERAADWFEGELAHERWHTMLAANVGGLAVLASNARSRAVAERILRDAPDTAFWAGAITNVPIAELRRRIRRDLASDAEIDRQFPVYDSSVLDHVKRFSEAHVHLVLDRRIQCGRSAAYEPHRPGMEKQCHQPKRSGTARRSHRVVKRREQVTRRSRPSWKLTAT
jgi:hypothetical protein